MSSSISNFMSIEVELDIDTVYVERLNNKFILSLAELMMLLSTNESPVSISHGNAESIRGQYEFGGCLTRHHIDLSCYFFQSCEIIIFLKLRLNLSLKSPVLAKFTLQNTLQ